MVSVKLLCFCASWENAKYREGNECSRALKARELHCLDLTSSTPMIRIFMHVTWTNQYQYLFIYLKKLLLFNFDFFWGLIFGL